MSLKTLVIVNTVLCVIGLIPAFGLQLATVMTGAAPGGGFIGSAVALAGFCFPAAPVVSILGSWIALWLGAKMLTLVFVGLPWVYLVMVLCGLLVLFAVPG